MRKFTLACACLLMSGGALAEVDHDGFYVGGGFGHANFTIDYEGQHLYQSSESVKDGIGSGSVFAGYNFTRMFGLELEMVTTGDLAESEDYEAAVFQISLAPRIEISLGHHVSLHGQFGVASTTYVESWDDVTAKKNSNAEDTLTWSGTSLTAGLGVEIAVFSGLNVRIAYDYTDVSDVSVSDSTAKDGNGATWKVPDLELELSRASVGVFWQF